MGAVMSTTGSGGRRLRRLSRVTAAVAAAAVVAAGGALSSPTSAAAAVADVPDCFGRVWGTLTATPSVVESRNPSTLAWNARKPAGCLGVSIRLGSVGVPAIGSQIVRPIVTTTYALTARVSYYDAELRKVVSASKVLARATVGVRGAMPVTMQLKRFRIDNADEDSWYSNGDEPWLMVFPILIDGTTVDLADAAHSSARVLSAPRAHDNLDRSRLRAGSDFSIPVDTGRFATQILPVRGVPNDVGADLATVAFAVVALEEDWTPDSAARAGRSAARAEIRDRVNALIRTLTIPDASSIDEIKAAVKSRAKAAITRATLASFGLFGFLDPDDYINAQVVQASYSAIRAAGTAGVPVNMTFAKSGVQYRVTGSIKAG